MPQHNVEASFQVVCLVKPSNAFDGSKFSKFPPSTFEISECNDFALILKGGLYHGNLD